MLTIHHSNQDCQIFYQKSPDATIYSTRGGLSPDYNDPALQAALLSLLSHLAKGMMETLD